MKKVIIALVLLILYACISIVVYAEESPISLSFEIAYEIDTHHGRYVFSNEPTNVELITGWQLWRFGPFLSQETYELRHFPLDTIVAFMSDDDNTLRDIIIFYFFLEHSPVPRDIDSSNELVLSGRFLQLQSSSSGLFLDFDNKTCSNACCDYLPIAIERPVFSAKFTIGSNSVHLSSGLSLDYDVAPFIDPVYGRTMIPLRALSEILRVYVGWDSDTRTVMLSTVEKVFLLNVDEPLPNDMGTLVIHENRVFVPVRYVAEILGATTRWDSENRAVYIYPQIPPA